MRQSKHYVAITIIQGMNSLLPLTLTFKHAKLVSLQLASLLHLNAVFVLVIRKSRVMFSLCTCKRHQVELSVTENLDSLLG